MKRARLDALAADVLGTPKKAPAVAAAPAPAEQVPAPKKGEPGYVAPGRKDEVAIIGYFDKAVRRQLKALAADEDTTVQALLEEALDALFIKHGKDAIARAGKMER